MKGNVHQIEFIKDSVYHRNGLMELRAEYLEAHLQNEDLKIYWDNVSAFSLEYQVYGRIKFFIELNERVLLRGVDTRCVYFYIERKYLSEIEDFVLDKKLNTLPRPNDYMMQYPFVKMYSKHMRQVLNVLSDVLNILLFLVLFARLWAFIDQKTGGLTKIQEILFTIGDWFYEKVPVTSTIIALPFYPIKNFFRLVRFIVGSLDEVSMMIFYLSSVMIYIYSTWSAVIKSLKLVLNLILAWKKGYNAIREALAKKKKEKEEKINQSETKKDV
ncbi:hypothetical protein EIN_328040 [Entamoeba invadens IP1]|uniref:Uncharacterized protein n=2 Tax=Entamoeba invadens TaxID=33085 RepID=A0A0A1TXP5_ENTIV|nr:hypothetical protein EIN_328040 [Entamoeba invadens IP1]ELP86147.1 hypothetical protein EIN_328040 [Entamoeba invadens IP1]BAN42066.1 hypothetical protein [Entamoeba invadens]|eukprot:XP_004185493.1 hypothetical protein EIN_328040 [Entamoeba invadens IP1]